jgi:hypothetical protein
MSQGRLIGSPYYRKQKAISQIEEDETKRRGKKRVCFEIKTAQTQQETTKEQTTQHHVPHHNTTQHNTTHHTTPQHNTTQHVPTRRLVLKGEEAES